LRGVVMFLFIVAEVTFKFPNSLNPTFLDHGTKFYSMPLENMITIIDIGQNLFMFVMGLMIPFAFRRHIREGGARYAWGQALLRVGFLYLVQIVGDLIGDGLSLSTLWGDTFSNLALGMLVSTVVASTIQSPEKRLYFALILLAIQQSLWFVLLGMGYTPNELFSLDYNSIIPFHVLGFSAVAIWGGCTWDWFVENKDPKIGIRRRILPVSTIALVSCVVMDYVQKADHYLNNPSIVLMSVGAGGFLFFIFFTLEREYHFKIPGLSALGANVLLLFIFGGVTLEIFLLGDSIFKPAIYTYFDTPLLALLFMVIYLAIAFTIAVPLDRKQWYFTPSLFLRLVQRRKKRTKD
jgi:hypothetical protein